MPVARERILKEVIRDIATPRPGFMEINMDCGDLPPPFGGFEQGVIIDRAGQRPGRRDRS
jgi:hypothetical protein